MKILMLMLLIMKNYFYSYTIILSILSIGHFCSAINGSFTTSSSLLSILRCKREILKNTLPPAGFFDNLKLITINTTFNEPNGINQTTVRPDHVHRLEFFESELMEFDFSYLINDKYLITIINRNNILYIGSVNQIFLITFKRKTFENFDLNNCNKELSSCSQVFCNGKYELMFVFENVTATDGPYPINKRCLPELPLFDNFNSENDNRILEWNELMDNQIVNLFHYNNVIFACGTARCGLCTGFTLDLAASRLFATEIRNYHRSFETYYDPYLQPVNMIASSTSSLLFFGHYHNANVLYTAFSSDGRDPELNAPFITSRVLQSKKIYQDGRPIISNLTNYLQLN